MFLVFTIALLSQELLPTSHGFYQVLILNLQSYMQIRGEIKINIGRGHDILKWFVKGQD